MVKQVVLKKYYLLFSFVSKTKVDEKTYFFPYSINSNIFYSIHCIDKFFPESESKYFE